MSLTKKILEDALNRIEQSGDREHRHVSVQLSDGRWVNLEFFVTEKPSHRHLPLLQKTYNDLLKLKAALARRGQREGTEMTNTMTKRIEEAYPQFVDPRR